MKANAKYKKPSKIYQAWANMKQRCFNKNALEYNSYGGRGITVCDDWVKSSASFEKWALENGYAEGLTLDRIDVDGNYEPSNCRWIDQRRQLRNKRDTIYIEYNGERKPLIDFCEEHGDSYWVDHCGERITTDVGYAMEWWECCMKPELEDWIEHLENMPNNENR